MSELKYEYYASVQEKDVEWLWYPYIPYGKLTLLQGDPGEGKSTFILNIVALLTTGRVMPDGYRTSDIQSVIYQCSEDGAEDTVKPRLMAAGADCKKVAYIIDDDKTLTFEDERIEEIIEKTGARLLVMDPLQSFIPQDGDLHSAGRMRSLLGNLSVIAEKHRCAIVLIGHMNKNNSGKSLYRGLGSIDIAAIVRSVLMVERDEEDAKIRYMYPIKSSLAPEGCAIAFKFDKRHGFQWIGPCDYKHYEVMEETQENKSDIAERILLALLKDTNMPSVEVLKYLSDIGISERTVNKVKKKLGIKSIKISGMWHWSLPNAEFKVTEAEEERDGENKSSRICETGKIMGEKTDRCNSISSQIL